MQIKKYRIDYNHWKCITKKSFYQKRLDGNQYRGYLGIIEIDKVSEPQYWKVNNTEIKVCDQGYKWIVYLPDDERICITSIKDNEGYNVLFYIDVIEAIHVEENQVIVYEDMFLDYIVLADGTIIEEDKEELQEAFEKGIISNDQYNRALQKGAQLMEGYLDSGKLCSLIQNVYEKGCK